MIRGTLGVGTLITNKTTQWKTKQSQNGKVGVFSVFILFILLNLQISYLSQKLQPNVHWERKGILNPRRIPKQHDLRQAWSWRQPMKLADHAHMEGRNATQGFHENSQSFNS